MGTQVVEGRLQDSEEGLPSVVGLRERKKRQMRQMLSDTATQMFVERGFDAVRVSEVAAACQVSEKTVFNYFGTKEALLLDRLTDLESSLRTGLADRASSPLQAVLAILAADLNGMTSMLEAQEDPADLIHRFRSVGRMIQSTPSLRAHQSDALDQLTSVAASILAERAGVEPDSPEPQIAATALLGLWPVQYRALGKYIGTARTPAEIRKAVTADVRRAAHVVGAGLDSMPAFAQAP
jgi:AcrR family transcriptional regulator